MTDQPGSSGPFDAVTTPAGMTTTCPQCGVSLDALTTACARCGAVITGGGQDGDRAERLRQRLQAQVGAAYELGPLIGRGGMGIVFRAREVSLDREVALKVLAFDALLNPEAFTRFEREARLAARLDHPNIVPIFAVGQGDGAAYYTMRFVRGGSLETLITEKGAVPVDDAVRLLREVASALDFAHALGIVHRDIKPANILLSESGHAMVADFGIARAFTGDSVTTSSASHTGVVGSPAYMAPEQWRGERPDGRADQYAMGVLAFELLSGVRPFRDASMQELLRLHLGEAAPTIDSVRPGLPPRVGQAIRRAMAKEPSDRFASASAFVAALAGETAMGKVPAARPAARDASGSASAQRGRQWLGNALAAVMVLTAAAVGWNAWRKANAPAAPAPAAAPVAAPAAPVPDTLAARLARELEETRKIALDAQRRAERAEAMQREAKSPVVPAYGHLSVAVRGGAPKLVIDGKEGAASTPAFLDVPTGRHVIRVEQQGREYLPQQYVIDVNAGDTNRLVFTDQRAGNRDFAQFQKQLEQLRQQPQSFAQGQSQSFTPGQVPRYARRPGDSTRTLVGGPTEPPVTAWVAPPPNPANPFHMPQVIWKNMSAQEQEMLRARWMRLSAEQQQQALKNIQLRDSTGAPLPRRPKARPQPQPPQPPQP